MIKREKSVIITRPLGEVFAFVSKPQEFPQWQTELSEVRKISHGSQGIGSRFVSVRKFLKWNFEDNVEIETFETNRKFVITSLSRSVPYKDSYLFESVEEGTKVTNLIEMYPFGIMKLTKPLIVGNLKRGMNSAFRNLKQLLESR